jgi:hypothetical protein
MRRTWSGLGRAFATGSAPRWSRTAAAPLRVVLAAGAAASLVGCVSEHAIAVELRLPRGEGGEPISRPEVVSYELRLYATGRGCPSLDEAASAAPFERLGAVQAFSAEAGMGEAIGEIPSGRWALAALARDETCGVRLFGCALLDVGVTAPSTVVVDLAPASSGASCGDCRACEQGACTPSAAECP